MRKFVFALGTAVASLIAITAVSVPAGAFGTLAPAGLRADARNMELAQDVAYVCRYRYYSGRRVCWWRPGYYAYGYYPAYRPYRWGFYRPYRHSWW